MTDGYIIAVNMPVVKSLYLLSIVTYLSEREQLSIFAVVVEDSQVILDSLPEAENRLDYAVQYRLEPYGKVKT